MKFQEHGNHLSCGCSKVETLDDSTQTCSLCQSLIPHCNECDSGKCSHCQAGYFLTSEGTCSSDQCDALNSNCQNSCSVKNCDQCDGDKCIKCMKNTFCELECKEDEIYEYFNVQRQCVKKCEGGNSLVSSVEIAGFKTPYCRYCGPDCEKCGESETGLQCLECKNNMLSFGAQCVNECPRGFNQNGASCKKCIGNSCI